LIFEKNVERAEGFTTATVATNPFIGGRDLHSKLGRRSALISQKPAGLLHANCYP
jgi:hypothetical protein